MVERAERLERSVLLVPASNWRMIEKAAASPADAVCIDLEDAVAPEEKEASRANVVRAFLDLDFGTKLRMYRMNGLDTPFAYRDLIDIVEGAGTEIDLVVVPKVDAPDDIRFVDRLLGQVERHEALARPIGVEALIETAAGCVNVREIAGSSNRLEALIYGSGDYAASVRMPLASIGEVDENDQIYPGHRWHYVMHAIVTAARAHGKRAIDGPFGGIRDPEGLLQACKVARAMGFDGKWCIHPGQIDTVNHTLVPSPGELEWALSVVSEYEAALRAGRGVISVEGKMIDVASLRVCQAVVEKARLAGLL